MVYILRNFEWCYITNSVTAQNKRKLLNTLIHHIDTKQAQRKLLKKKQVTKRLRLPKSSSRLVHLSMLKLYSNVYTTILNN